MCNKDLRIPGRLGNVPLLSETFRFVPFRSVPIHRDSVWFRTDFLLPGAELRVLSAEC